VTESFGKIADRAASHGLHCAREFIPEVFSSVFDALSAGAIAELLRNALLASPGFSRSRRMGGRRDRA
jgi:hypothetical protein